jgi:hypothetical protein
MTKLSKEDRYALQIARMCVKASITSARRKFGRDVTINPMAKHAIKVIDRLLKRTAKRSKP